HHVVTVARRLRACRNRYPTRHRRPSPSASRQPRPPPARGLATPRRPCPTWPRGRNHPITRHRGRTRLGDPGGTPAEPGPTVGPLARHGLPTRHLNLAATARTPRNAPGAP